MGVVFWATALWMDKKPPKKINNLYGYRTKRSMSSQEGWDFAQVYSANLMRKMGQFMLLFAALWIFVPIHFVLAEVLVSVAISIGTCIYLLVQTENELKKQFD